MNISTINLINEVFKFSIYYLRYDKKENTPVKLIEVQLICAMGTPENGGRDVTPRFKRHFFTLSISEFENQVMIMIFSKIILWHLDTRYFYFIVEE